MSFLLFFEIRLETLADRAKYFATRSLPISFVRYPTVTHQPPPRRLRVTRLTVPNGRVECRFLKRASPFRSAAIQTNSNGDGGGLDETIDFALEIASALERTLRDRNTRIKTVAGWTGANERTVKNWLSGQYGPCGAHLVVLIQHSDEVLNAVLSMRRRHDLVFAQKLGDLEQRMRELMSTLKELRSSEPGKLTGLNSHD
jgi:hypothetical protein